MDELDPRLVKAIEDGNLQLLQALLTEAGNFEEVGIYLISHAVLYMDVDILRWLLAQGADPNLADLFEDGHPALYWAIFNKRPLNWDVVKTLVEGGARVLGGEPPDDGATPLHLAAEEGDLELTRYLLDHADGGRALNYFDQFDDTPLHKAVKSNSVAVASLLLQAGADVNALVHIEPVPRIGDTPIRDTVEAGHVEMTQLLMSHGADPDRPGWMWGSARSDLDRNSSQTRTDLEQILLVPPLTRMEDCAHLQQLEAQLIDDLKVLGIHAHQLDWSHATPSDHLVQVRQKSSSSANSVRMLDQHGEALGSGAFDFVVLTAEIDFRAFWTALTGFKANLQTHEQIPARVWETLTEDQQSWIIMDDRNRKWRKFGIGYLVVQGVAPPELRKGPPDRSVPPTWRREDTTGNESRGE